LKFSRSVKDITARPNLRARIESMQNKNEYLHALSYMSKTIGDNDLNALTKQLLAKKCMKRGSKYHYSDADGHYLGCSYCWKSVIITTDAHRQVCGDLNFENQDAKHKLVIFAENEQPKRQRTTVQEKRTVTRNMERLATRIDRGGSLCDSLQD
jgi:hypothetical protein